MIVCFNLETQVSFIALIPTTDKRLLAYSEAVEGLLINQSSHFIDVNLNALTLQILA
jgi:hypothetical protein